MLLKSIQQKGVEYVVAFVVFLVLAIKHAFAVLTCQIINEHLSALSYRTTANNFTAGWNTYVTNIPYYIYFKSNLFHTREFGFDNVIYPIINTRSGFTNLGVNINIITQGNLNNGNHAKFCYVLNSCKELMLDLLTRTLFKLSNLNQS